ncbi:MAG: amino acid adenylation domain-containing protein, partial [Ignavibacteria bacterium]
ERIKRMCGHFKELLNSILDNPEYKISELQILSGDENKFLLSDVNNTHVNYNLNQSIVDLFSLNVKSTPDAIAVWFEDKALTYQELDNITNQLGNLLIKKGVKNNSFVGVYIDRSLEMITALLGILKAGGAYVPIDPSYPEDRVNYMIEDSGINIILSKSNLSEKISGRKIEILNIDKISLEQAAKPEIKKEPHDLAYMIYTSGSTGKPKGAMNTNEAIINRLLWMKDYLKISSSDTIFQKTSFSFDVSVWEFFLPLISGAKLVFAVPEGHKDTKYLIQEIINKNITHIHFVPSMLQVFLEDEEVSKCNSLKAVICSGEELTISLQQLFFSKLKDTELHNLYGPTEAAVDVTFWKCEENSDSKVVPIGKPVANTQIYILDPYLKPVPVGVPGELHIGGVQVARGYHNRDEMTLEKFIQDPFSKIRTARLYKTGDLVRYLNDGNIEYLGRMDNQIKIRGFRIELGEIEFVMNQYEDLKEAVVIAKEFKKGDKRLIAFVIPKNNVNVKTEDLRNYLKLKLPDYMVPSQIVFLEKMPLSQNGKIDRKFLNDYEFTRDENASDYVSASTNIEQKLVNIWKETLSINKIGIHDNFFEFGGDSILSIQIISQANQQGLKITLKQIFQYQTIAELSKVIEISDTSEIIDQGNVSGEVLLTPVQKWFFNLDLPEPHHFSHSVLLTTPSGLNPVFLKRAVEAVVKQHDALRLRFKKEGKEWMQTNSEFENAELFDVEDVSAIDSQVQNKIIESGISKLQTTLDLANGPLIKMRLFKTGDNSDRLLILIHHLCIDVVSWRIILEDIYNVYYQLSRGEEIVLPSKTTSFKEWSKKLSKYSNNEKISTDEDYWLNFAGKYSEQIPKDYDKDNLQNTISTAGTVSIIINEQSTEAILHDVQKIYNTKINDILLTALIIAYQKWSDKGRLVLTLEGHGREEIFDNTDVSRTVGWFTSMFPVLLNIENADDIGESIKSVKEKIREIPNNGIGYGILKYLHTNSSVIQKLNAVQQPEIIFNYLGQITGKIGSRLGSDWSLSKSAIELSQNQNGLRSHLIEINSIIIENKIKMEFIYSRNFHKKETIEQFSKYYEDALELIIEHCKSPEAGGYTPSDFSSAGLDQQELDNLLANLN